MGRFTPKGCTPIEELMNRERPTISRDNGKVMSDRGSRIAAGQDRTDEERARIVEYAKQHGGAVACRRFQISKSTLSGWRRMFAEPGYRPSGAAMSAADRREQQRTPEARAEARERTIERLYAGSIAQGTARGRLRTDEERMEAVQHALRHGPAAACRKYGITKPVIYQWGDRLGIEIRGIHRRGRKPEPGSRRPVITRRTSASTPAPAPAHSARPREIPRERAASKHVEPPNARDIPRERAESRSVVCPWCQRDVGSSPYGDEEFVLKVHGRQCEKNPLTFQHRQTIAAMRRRAS